MRAEVFAAKAEAQTAADEAGDLASCPHCGRSFNRESLQRHMAICQKVFTQKQKSLAHRDCRHSIACASMIPTKSEPLSPAWMRRSIAQHKAIAADKIKDVGRTDKLGETVVA